MLSRDNNHTFAVVPAKSTNSLYYFSIEKSTMIFETQSHVKFSSSLIFHYGSDFSPLYVSLTMQHIGMVLVYYAFTPF